LAIDYYSKVVIFVKSLPKASKKTFIWLLNLHKIIIIEQKFGNNELEKDYKNKRKWFIEELRNLGEIYMKIYK
jgi:hypothetical protein